MSGEFKLSAGETSLIIDTTLEHTWGAQRREPVTALSILQQSRDSIALQMDERLGQLERHQQQIARITEMDVRDTATLASLDEAIAQLAHPAITLSEDEARIGKPNEKWEPGTPKLDGDWKP